MSGQQENVSADAEVRIEQLSDLKHFDSCVEIERAVWGYNPEDIIPSRVFLVASKIGGQVLGAFVDGRMAGFAMALPGFRDGRPYLHSHMLGVLAEYRNTGLGRRLKLRQRDDALARGIDHDFGTSEIDRVKIVLARYPHARQGGEVINLLDIVERFPHHDRIEHRTLNILHALRCTCRRPKIENADAAILRE